MRFPPEKLYFSYKMTIEKGFRTVKKKDPSPSGDESGSAGAIRKNAIKRKPRPGAWMAGDLRRPQAREGAFCAVSQTKDSEAGLGHRHKGRCSIFLNEFF